MQTVNPLIEQRGLWGTFHRHFIVELFEWLRDRLGDAYLVDMESEVLLIPRLNGPGRSVSPDVEVTRLNPLYDGSGTATLTPSPAVLEVDETLDEVEQYAIQVRRRDWLDPFDPFGSRIVSVIELLSSSNKGVFGAADRRKFLAKRGDYLSSPVSQNRHQGMPHSSLYAPFAVAELICCKLASAIGPRLLSNLKTTPTWSGPLNHSIRHAITGVGVGTRPTPCQLLGYPWNIPTSIFSTWAIVTAGPLSATAGLYA